MPRQPVLDRPTSQRRAQRRPLKAAPSDPTDQHAVSLEREIFGAIAVRHQLPLWSDPNHLGLIPRVEAPILEATPGESETAAGSRPPRSTEPSTMSPFDPGKPDLAAPALAMMKLAAVMLGVVISIALAFRIAVAVLPVLV